MIKTVIKHKIADICIDQLFNGIFKNFSPSFGETITLGELRDNPYKYAGKYITLVSINTDIKKSDSIQFNTVMNIINTVDRMNLMVPILLNNPIKTENGHKIQVNFNFNKIGQFIFNDYETNYDVILLTVCSEIN